MEARWGFAVAERHGGEGIAERGVHAGPLAGGGRCAHRPRARRGVRGGDTASGGRTLPSRRCAPTPRSTPSSSARRTICTGARAAAIKAGKHVLCEKPLTITTEDGSHLVEAARRAGVVLAVRLLPPLYPVLERLQEIVPRASSGR